MKGKISKLMMLFVFTIMVASPAASATTLNTHLDSVSPITCNQGDTVSVTAQLWTENYIDGLWDNPMNNDDLYFHLYTEDHVEVLEKKEMTKHFKGKATTKINTGNLDPGKYILIVELKESHL
ncbi:MAG: hypothetical protein F8N15_06190 [Methanobacterium sp.]|nr:hypothetical protein [Methanobacterium sp.]